MNILRYSLILFLFSSTVAMAAPASDSSIKQLLTATQAHRLVDGMRTRMAMIMQNAAMETLKGKKPNAKQEQAIKHMSQRMTALLQKGFSWQKLEPMYIKLYKESFTAKEVADMLAFYKTPTGQDVIRKMPLLMQKAIQNAQMMAKGLVPQMQKIQQQFASEMQAADK